MDLKQRLQDDLKEALRAGEERRKSVIRMALAAITNAEIEKGRRSGQTELDEDEVVAVLQKQAKQRRETIDELEETDRADLLAAEEKELAILEEYLPEQLSREEIAEEARQVITEVEATGMGDMGPVMGRLMSRLKGRADGHIVNEVVRQLLANQ
ncbi:MAG: GatB/YqeY domain-containing protein [Chloroflexota bacterium]|nr:GatB/YqeY domain-containing protein [Chloroflexota bacterium]